MLNRSILQYIITPFKRSVLWNQGYALFARLKNLTVSFTEARKVKMAMPSNAKFAGLPRDANITKSVLRYALPNMLDGQKEILKKSVLIKELIIKEIAKRFWKKPGIQEKKMDMQTQKHIGKGIEKRLHAIIMSLLQSNLAILSVQKHVMNVKFNVSHKLTTMIMKSHWKSFGFVRNVMAMSIEQIYQRERLNLETSKEDAIVQTTEETCREKSEAVSPPRNWSVSSLWLKVIERLRHTAGCSFYQGQCITNDLWLQNLRSTMFF